MKALDSFYLQQEEPVKGCLLALKEIILLQDKEITNEWKYGGPFFCYKGKMFCYVWFRKKDKQLYIGLIEGNRFNEPFLIQEKRSRIKIMLIDPNKDLPVKKINYILQKALDLYRGGVIKIKEKSCK